MFLLQPEVTRQALNKVSVTTLKNGITTMGGDCTNCLEKSDLIDLYLELIRKQSKRYVANNFKRTSFCGVVVM